MAEHNPELEGVQEESIPVSLSPTKRDLWMEAAVVLGVGVLPYWAHAILPFVWPEHQHALPSAYDSLLRLVTAFSAVAPASYFIWKNSDAWTDYGLSRPRWTDLLSGLGVFFAGKVVWILAEATLNRANAWGLLVEVRLLPIPQPFGPVEVGLALAWCVANGFSEEVVMRAYLLTRLERLLGSTTWALIVTTILFAGYHAYQGGAGVVFAVVFGLVYGGIFCWSRRIWPLVIAHAIADFEFMSPGRG